MSSKKKLSLPKSVLEMKFMKKSKERIQKEIENSEGHETLYSGVITSDMRQASGNYITESSFIYCVDLLEGRLSFKGMNPEIERLMEQGRPKENDADMQKDVSDEVLAKKMDMFNKRKRRSSPSKYNYVKKRR